MHKSTSLTPTIILFTASNMLRIMKHMRYTFKQFKAEYPDDQACLVSVLENRYDGTCPRCGVIGVKFHPITTRKGFVCSECDKHIYPLKDTIFQKSTASLWNGFYAIYLFSVAKNGVSAKELERHLGVTYKTAWRICKQIRKLMEQDGDMLDGDVEVDETYAPSRRHPRNIGRSKKQIIFGAVERNGRASVVHV
jgi:transposase-like protein